MIKTVKLLICDDAEVPKPAEEPSTSAPSAGGSEPAPEVPSEKKHKHKHKDKTKDKDKDRGVLMMMEKGDGCHGVLITIIIRTFTSSLS